MRSLDNPELFTQEEKEVNRKSAYAAYAADAAAAYANAAYDATYAAAAYTADDKVISKIDHWLARYFQTTGKDKQTYINEVERLRG